MSKEFNEQSEKKEVKFINSLALASPDKDGDIRHFQIVIVQELETGEFRLMYDVVDPSKIKLQDESNVPSSYSA